MSFCSRILAFFTRKGPFRVRPAESAQGVMPRKPAKSKGDEVLDYRYDAKRKNIPPAGLAARGKILAEAKVRYSYNPHLAPTLRFDATGREDGLPELLKEALQRPLSADEAKLLAEAIRNQVTEGLGD